MKNVNFYIDGFNFYHPLDDFQRYGKNKICLKWLNYKSFCESLLLRNEVIGTIYLFTAIRSDFKFTQPEKYKRHKSFIKALKAYGVTVIQGRFLERIKDVKCQVIDCDYQAANTNKKKFTLKYKEEKRTDVNIACYLVKDAFLNKFERAVLLSADTDLVPAIQIVKKHFENKIITVGVLPAYNREEKKFFFHKVADLKKTSESELLKINFSRLSSHLMPAEILGLEGKLIKMPEVYTSSEQMIEINKKQPKPFEDLPYE